MFEKRYNSHSMVVLNDNSLEYMYLIILRINNLHIYLTMLQSYRKIIMKVRCVKPASTKLNSLYFYFSFKLIFKFSVAVIQKRLTFFLYSPIIVALIRTQNEVWQQTQQLLFVCTFFFKCVSVSDKFLTSFLLFTTMFYN